MSAHLHGVSAAAITFLLGTAAASMLPAAGLAAAIRSRTVAYRASRPGSPAA